MKRIARAEKSLERIAHEEELLEILIEGIELEWKGHISCVLSGSEYSVQRCGTCDRLRRATPLLKELYPELYADLIGYRI